MKKTFPSHKENLVSLRRIEGQVRGIQRLIQERKYCVDILIQVSAVMHALGRVQEKILKEHFSHCVSRAFAAGTAAEKEKKLREILDLIHRFRKL